MPRALITGISGQDGSYLAELLLEHGHEVFGIVRGSPQASYANLAGIRDDIQLLQGDLLDHMTLLDAIGKVAPDELYNLAATSFVPESWRQPVMTSQFTAIGVTCMLEAARIVSPELRICQASSSEIFGASSQSPQNEGSSFRPRNPYGIAKLHAHLMVGVYRERHGLHASSAILYNHESPRRGLDFVTRKVTRTAAAIKLGLAHELRLGDLDATRDWSYAGDVVEAMYLMLQQPEGDDYVVCSGVSRTVRELVQAAFAAAGLDDVERFVVVDAAFARPPEPVALVGDPSKVRGKLGWQPRVSFERTIAMMVEADLLELGERPGSG